MSIVPSCLLPSDDFIDWILSVEDARVVIEKTKGISNTGQSVFLTDYEILSDKIQRVVYATTDKLVQYKHEAIDNYILNDRSKLLIDKLQLFDPEKEKFNKQIFNDTCVGKPLFDNNFIILTLDTFSEVVKDINPLLNYIRTELSSKLSNNALPPIKHIYDKLETIGITQIPTSIQLSMDDFMGQKDTKGLPLASLNYSVNSLVDLIVKFSKFTSLDKPTMINVIDSILHTYLDELVKQLDMLNDKHLKEIDAVPEVTNEYLKVFHRIKLIYNVIDILQILFLSLTTICNDLTSIMYYFDNNRISVPQVAQTIDGEIEPHVNEYEPEYINS